MRLKPRTTVNNPRALLYKRFTSIEESESLSHVYKTISDNLFWTFDNVKLQFNLVSASEIDSRTAITLVIDFDTILVYQGTYFQYNGLGWQNVTNMGGIETLNLQFNNIGKYQTNQYYYVGSFDYIIKGSIEGTTTQYMKGNILPLTSMNIKYFDDDVNLEVGDLVVVDGHLYSVENPETVLKQMPRPFKVHFATLNSIL